MSPPHIESLSANYAMTKRDSPKAPAPLPPSLEIPTLPKRGDSLQGSSGSVPQVTRKEVPSSSNTLSPANGLSAGAGPASPVAPTSRASLESPGSAGINGGRVISRPMESPISKSSLDFPIPPAGSAAGTANISADSFVSPRAAPQIPASAQAAGEKQGGADENGARSPGLPQYQTSGDLSMAEDMARILGHDESDKSFLKRVSNSVRHARSHSDRGSHNGRDRWPKTPLNGHAPGAAGAATSGTGMGSPTAQSSPESTKDEVVRLRESLRLERQRAAERTERLSELEAAFEGKETIQKLDGELQKRRSTMVVLDTQKELVVRELEVLTEHIAAEKQSGRPLDAARLTQTVVRDLARELRTLKESFRAPIEDLVERKRGLADEVARLEGQKERALREFEQLSLKNAQLAELNNTLVHQVNELSRQQAEAGGGKGAGAAPTGLGIYTPPPPAGSKGTHLGNVDFRALGVDPPPAALGHRPSLADGMEGGDAAAANTATVVGAAPRVVNLRKEQPTKKTFNWKKGGHMAKGMTKGLKGAFSSGGEREGNKTLREGSLAERGGPVGGGLTEGTPYGAMVQNEQPSTVLPPPRGGMGPGGNGGLPRGDGSGAFALFGQPKGRNGVQGKGANGVARGPAAPDASSTSRQRVWRHGSESADMSAATLFGSELAARAEYERVGIPSIVTRCIQEVELRGTLPHSLFRLPCFEQMLITHTQAWTARASTASPAATRRSRPSATASRPATTSTWPTRTSTSTPSPRSSSSTSGACPRRSSPTPSTTACWPARRRTTRPCTRTRPRRRPRAPPWPRARRWCRSTRATRALPLKPRPRRPKVRRRWRSAWAACAPPCTHCRRRTATAWPFYCFTWRAWWSASARTS